MVPFGKRQDTVVHGDDPFNAEPRRAALGSASITPLDRFYVRNHGAVPELPADADRVALDGLVERPLQLSVDELRNGFPRRELTATLQCAGNRRAGLIAVRDIPGEAPWGPGATGTARWAGAALADVLAAASPRSDAAHVGFLGRDRSEDADPPQRYGASIPLAKADMRRCCSRGR